MGEQTPVVVKNENVEVDVIGIGHEGEGVGRANGFTLFIPGALPGEKVLAKVLKVKKSYGYAKLLDVIVSIPDRIEAPCAIYTQCGGCQLQHLTYEAQLKWKRQMVVDSLERIGKLDLTGIPVHDTIGMDEPWQYRNKAQVPFGMSEKGLVAGFYAKGSHRIIDMNQCLIQNAQNDQVVQLVKEIAGQLGIRAYSEETGKGLLRHVVVRYGFTTGEVMVVLVTNGESLPHRDEFIHMLRGAVPGLKSICQNVNKAKTNVIFGDVTRVIWGEDTIRDTIGDVEFLISARSFYQVNPIQTEVLYQKAVDYAQLTGKETVVDAYCGIGTISLFLAKHAADVYGVEIVPEAIEDAKRNAQINAISNATFKVGDASKVFASWQNDGIRADVVVVDPPRKGVKLHYLNPF
jgi:23S rRNA (uracil1939-C5)-methyltransferase